MDFIRIVEDAMERYGWRAVNVPGEPAGQGWEAVPKRGNHAKYEVQLDGVPQGHVVARSRLTGKPHPDYRYQAELGMPPDPVRKVGHLWIAPFNSCVDFVVAHTTGTAPPYIPDRPFCPPD
ncbi:hypothetical protein [Streptomyces sp. CB03238]|uniref:hypothetical protein n=1 Tax=Streptomyces sp. CB03238 TaxID=1907777 RepID=UPI000A1226CA|nr:hypothetical protein [Streptomyces sp. CB03238]ORT58142.1 hypothetical protein BKD26_19770 [Streptomyces sp. CB03238]